MRTVRRSALVPYSAEQMFALANDIAAYPEFLPWCSRAEVESQDGDIVIARIEVARGNLKKAFRTRNRINPPRSIEMHLLDGPFSKLDGGWQFQPLGEDGCKVLFQIDFELENRLMFAVFGRYFEDISNRMVDAFIQRADAVYSQQ